MTEVVYERIDVGSLFGVFVAAFIVIACAATLFARGVRVETAKDAALALGPVAGRYALALFGLGLLNASVFTAAILPLSTAYVVCDAFGWESGLNCSWQQAPIFFATYTAMIVLSAGVILLPVRLLVQVMLASQTMNGVLLPFVLVVMLRLVNDRRMMGRFASGAVLNVVSWVIVAALIALTAALLVVSISPRLAA